MTRCCRRSTSSGSPLPPGCGCALPPEPASVHACPGPLGYEAGVLVGRVA
jgi:hypothetical protein